MSTVRILRHVSGKVSDLRIHFKKNRSSYKKCDKALYKNQKDV